MRIAIVLGLLGCPSDDDPDETGDTDRDLPAGFSSLLLDAAPETGILLGAWSNGDEVLFVGGDFGSAGRITHFDGGAFCVEPDPVEGILWWVHGRAPGDWYAVGERGIVVHEANGVRSRDDLPTTATVFGVYDDGTDVWAVTGDVANTQTGAIWRKPGGGPWEAVLEDIDGLMFKAWNGWFVGDGKAYFWDGSQLLERHPPIPDGATRAPKLLTVRGESAEHIWAVGGQAQPTLLEWNGSWTVHEVAPECGGNAGLNGVWTGPGDDLAVAGASGAASRYDGTTWTCDSPPLTDQLLHTAWPHQGEWLYAGGDFFEFGANHGTILVHPPRSTGPLPVTVCP